MRKKPEQRGAAAVEFALVLLPLAMLVMGGIDWSYYFYVEHIVAQAARAGARAGSVETDAGVALDRADQAVRDTIAVAGLDLAKLAAPDISFPGTAIRVEVAYAAPALTGLSQRLMTGSARAVAEMRSEVP